MRQVVAFGVAALAVVLAWVSQAGAQAPVAPPGGERPAPVPGRIAHIRVIGDLDHARVGKDIVGALARARREKTALIILELESQRSRPDVVWEVGRATGESETPVVAYLHEGPGGRVGAGALEIGLLAKDLYLQPRTDVREDGEDDLRWSAPADVNWERVERELRGALWVALKEHGADQVVGTLLVARRPSAWCTPADAPEHWKIAVSEPAQGSGVRARQIVLGADAGTGAGGRIELPADVLVGLGVAKGSAASVSQVIAACGKGPATRSTTTITSDLPGARRRLDGALEEAKTARLRATELLDVKKRARGRTVTSTDYHESARDAGAEIERCAGAIKAADTEIAEFPELIRRKPEARDAALPKRRGRPEDPVPGALAELEKELDKLRARADEYAKRK
jgi:hypothetical protein